MESNVQLFWARLFMFLNAHTSAKIDLEMCECFTALAFTCNHFSHAELFKQDKLVLKDLRFHVRLHVCQRYSSYSYFPLYVEG